MDLIIVAVAMVLLIGLSYGGRISGGAVVSETLIAPGCESGDIVDLVKELRDMRVRVIDCAKLIGRDGTGGNIGNIRVIFSEKCVNRNVAIGVCKNALNALKGLKR